MRLIRHSFSNSSSPLFPLLFITLIIFRIHYFLSSSCPFFISFSVLVFCPLFYLVFSVLTISSSCLVYLFFSALIILSCPVPSIYSSLSSPSRSPLSSIFYSLSSSSCPVSCPVSSIYSSLSSKSRPPLFFIFFSALVFLFLSYLFCEFFSILIIPASLSLSFQPFQSFTAFCSYFWFLQISVDGDSLIHRFHTHTCTR